MKNEREETDPDATKGMIRVFGRNILRGPLFETNDAQTLIMYNGEGRPCVVVTRLVDNQWVMGCEADDDWEDTKARLGIE